MAWLGRHPGAGARQCIFGRGGGSGILERQRRYPGSAQMKKLCHYDEKGRASMVDVSAKVETKRTATAQAFVKIRPSVLKKLPHNPKGNPLEVARLAAIAPAETTSALMLARKTV